MFIKGDNQIMKLLSYGPVGIIVLLSVTEIIVKSFTLFCCYLES
jgi:hypothetical protein